LAQPSTIFARARSSPSAPAPCIRTQHTLQAHQDERRSKEASFEMANHDDAVSSRPPLSRFQEGSMNDRVSAAPPAQFLGPEALARFERQFYTGLEKQQQQQQHHQLHSQQNQRKYREQRAIQRTRSLSRQRERRPQSAEAHLVSLPYSTLHAGGDDQQAHQQAQDSDESSDQQSLQKKTGFLGRVRDAFGFGRTHKHPSKVQQEIEKRTSLQVLSSPTSATTTQTQPIAIAGASAGRTVDANGSTLIEGSRPPLPQFPASFQGTSLLSDRPSRDEIMQSYNQLMASGFFKAHAIQSTRQPPPGSGQGGGDDGHERRRAPPPAPLALLSSPIQHPPHRRGHRVSLSAPNSPLFGGTGYSPAAPPPVPTHAPPPPPSPAAARVMAEEQLKSRSSWESLRQQLRGSRKRTRAVDSDDNASLKSFSSTQHQQPAQAPTSVPSNSAAGVAVGIGRRVSKKLRKMPSIIASQVKGGGDEQSSSSSSTAAAAGGEQRPSFQLHERRSSKQQGKTKKRIGPPSFRLSQQKQQQQQSTSHGTGNHGGSNSLRSGSLRLGCVAPRTPSTPGPAPRLRKRPTSSSLWSTTAATTAVPGASVLPSNPVNNHSAPHHRHHHGIQELHHQHHLHGGGRHHKAIHSHTGITTVTGKQQQQQQSTRAAVTANWELMDVDDDEQHRMSVDGDDDIVEYGGDGEFNPNHEVDEGGDATSPSAWHPPIVPLDRRVSSLLQRGRLGVPSTPASPISPATASAFTFTSVDAAVAAASVPPPPEHHHHHPFLPLGVVPEADTNQQRGLGLSIPFDFGGGSCVYSAKPVRGVWSSENSDVVVTAEEVAEDEGGHGARSPLGVRYGEAL
jgi:hypothetical protein